MSEANVGVQMATQVARETAALVAENPEQMSIAVPKVAVRW